MTTAKSQQFLNELAQFYRNKGQHNVTSDDLIARLNGKQVNLCELYSNVIEMGGSYKVNQYAKWDDIYLKLFSPQPLASNVSVALRQIYQRYLLAYEKANYSNYISDNINDDDDESTNKDSNLNLNFLTNNNQVAIHQQSSNANLNPLNKLFCSLMSDLPNEMDFGLRVATILTNSEKIDNLADFKFVNVIIECCILYICSCERIDYSKSTDYKFEDEEFSNLDSKDELERVAKNVIDNLINQDNQINDLTLEHKENINSNRSAKSLSNKFTENHVCKFVPFKDCKCFVKFWCKMIQNDEIMKFIFDLSNTELLDLYDETYCEQEEHQKNYYKIKRITSLLKNLSYSIEKLRQDQNLDYDEYSKNLNDLYDSASINLLRFLILLLNSNDQSFINTALEIISNISPLVNSNLNNLVDQQTYIRLLVYIYDWCVDKVLNSLDVNYLNRSLEILAKLINSNHIAMNRLIISEIFDQTSIYKRLTELLTCQHDVGVVISALEFTLSLSENYPKSLLNDNKHLVKVLINLINCDEGQYFSKNSIKKIRIIDETQRMPHHLIIQQQNHYQQPQTIYIHQSQPAITNQKIIQLNDNQAIIIDNEQHLKNWLYSNFEVKTMNNNSQQQSKMRLKLTETYNDYIKYSCLSGRRNVVTSQTFSNLLKKYFPSVTFINSSEIDGLVMKAGVNKLSNISIIQQQPQQQLIQTHPQIIINSTSATTVSTTTANNLTSPILKAHLSTPPKSNSSNQISNPSIINSNNQQPQLPNGPTTASPLIKNLLANKLRNNNQTSTINSNLDDSKSIVTTTNLLNQHQTLANNNSVLIATNSSQQNLTTVTSTNTPNLITVQQHLLPNATSNSMIINTNQLNNTPGTGQILLVRTILPQQNNQNTGQTTNQQSMRLILPASVLTTHQSSLPQTINLINGTANLTQTSTTVVSTSQNLQNSLITTVTNSSPINKQLTDDKKQQSNDSNQLIRSVLRSPPTIVNNCSNTAENQQKPISNNVKSSPLLNVLLDKGKLPDYSTTVSNDNAQDNKIIKNNVSPQIVVSTQSSQLTNHIIANPSSSSTIINTTSNSSLPNQIVATSTVNNTNPTKMYILTTTSKSPISIKNANSITTSSNSTSIPSFVIQQSTAPNKTNTGIINQTNGQPTQFILQQNQTLINSQNNTVVISQPLIVQQQQPSTVCTTIQNPKLDQSIANKDKQEQVNNVLTNNNMTIIENNTIVNNTSKDNNTVEIKSNCVVKRENGEINDKEIVNKNSPISDKKSNNINETTSPIIITNGCLDKEKIEHMQIDEEPVKEAQQKDSLLKRQLESNDTFIKRSKNDSQLAIIPVQTTIKQESQLINKPILNNSSNQINHNKKDDTITAVVVSSNGLIPNQPTISNTLIKTALNSYIPKTNSTTCTIEKITIAKPNVVLNSNLNENIKLSPVVVQQKQPQKPKQNKLELEYICEWSNCKKSFSQPNQVFLHVHLDHISPLDENKSMKCAWGGPEGTGPGCKSLRPKYSLLTHLQDFHCGIQQLKQVAQRNQQLLTKGITDIPPIIPPAHPGYANNAAFLAIKRHSSNLIENKPIQNVGPLSKSVRLTAAMILRNLAQHSNSIKRLLKNYESYLSELCIFDSREDSRTLAQCLAVISEEK